MSRPGKVDAGKSAGTRRGLLSAAAIGATLTAIGRSIPTAAASPPASTPDARLRQLGRALDHARALEDAAWKSAQAEHDDDGPFILKARRLGDELSPLLAKIEKARATTLAGLIVKMRAVN